MNLWNAGLIKIATLKQTKLIKFTTGSKQSVVSVEYHNVTIPKINTISLSNFHVKFLMMNLCSNEHFCRCRSHNISNKWNISLSSIKHKYVIVERCVIRNLMGKRVSVLNSRYRGSIEKHRIGMIKGRVLITFQWVKISKLPPFTTSSSQTQRIQKEKQMIVKIKPRFLLFAVKKDILRLWNTPPIKNNF